jgi:putative ABC transport system permease protein
MKTSVRQRKRWLLCLRRTTINQSGMNAMNLIRIALKALQRNKLRAFLTMLGIIIGVAAVIAMVAIGEGSKQSIQSQLSSMGSNMITILPSSNVSGGVRIEGASFQSLTIEDVRAIEKNAEYVSEVSPVASTKGQAIYGALNWPTSLQGVGPAYFDIRKLVVKDGVSFSDADVATSAKVCVLGQTVINNLFPSGESPVGKVIRLNSIPLQVIGTLEPKGQSSFGQDQDDIILTPYTTVQKRILATTYFQSIYASAINEGASAQATEEIISILRETHRLRPTDENNFQVSRFYQ